MTESKWLKPGVLFDHVNFLRGRNRERKLRLFDIACCRQLEQWIDEPKLFDAIVRAEQFADGELSHATITKWRRKVDALGQQRRADDEQASAAQLAVYSYVSTTCRVSKYVESTDNWRMLIDYGEVFSPDFASHGTQLVHALMLDIFGNPFRTIPFLPEWRTDTAVSLAQQMYESREFSAMPILADALQDAGCDRNDILNHCRDANQVHVRGCWVVDLVLGKA
jgi:hypothetical protein